MYRRVRQLACSDEIDSHGNIHKIREDLSLPRFPSCPRERTGEFPDSSRLVSADPAGVPLTRFIFIPDYQPEEDNGNWTCVAGLKGENNYVEEAWDFINVTRDTVNVSLITVLAIILATLLFLIMVIIGYIYGRYKLRRSMPENPPAYDTQYYPKSFKFDMKERQC